MTKKAIFTYGRLNPPTIGHHAMINELLRVAAETGSDPFIVITHTQNRQKNPLTADEKRALIQYAYPGVPVLVTSKNEPNPIYIQAKLKNNGYNNISMMVGSDRFNSKVFTWTGIPQLSAGVRNANENNRITPSSASATKARNAARRKNINSFTQLVPSNNPMKLMLLVKSRLDPPKAQKERNKASIKATKTIRKHRAKNKLVSYK